MNKSQISVDVLGDRSGPKKPSASTRRSIMTKFAIIRRTLGVMIGVEPSDFGLSARFTSLAPKVVFSATVEYQCMFPDTRRIKSSNILSLDMQGGSTFSMSISFQ